MQICNKFRAACISTTNRRNVVAPRASARSLGHLRTPASAGARVTCRVATEPELGIPADPDAEALSEAPAIQEVPVLAPATNPRPDPRPLDEASGGHGKWGMRTLLTWLLQPPTSFSYASAANLSHLISPTYGWCHTQPCRTELRPKQKAQRPPCSRCPFSASAHVLPVGYI